ncbi:unnamed protein product [Caenorhabditis angaria]|uniref:Ion channel n=1 Tax=Caenorhabditis angaria TaxID=860376 RepID=A0A9P1ITT0_9PELO|nr:unnamed protein product [Caenorhabditis angaria]
MNLFSRFGASHFDVDNSEKWTNTYCDLNIIIEQVLIAIYGYMDTDMISLLNDLMSNPSEIKDMVPFITGLLNTSEREDLSWDVTDLFYWIAFEDQRLDLTRDIYKWNDVVLGNCFTFNHYYNNITYLMRDSGQHGGILANMRCRQDEYAPWYDTAAINVFIHSRDEYVFSESVRYNAPPNAKSNINIYDTYYTRLGGKYGVCIKEASEVKAYYYPLAYTTDGCLRTCYQDMIYAACDCMDPRYPAAANVTTCQLANRTCVTEASDDAGDPSTWSSCVCPLPCSNQQYSVTWSAANFAAAPQSCVGAANQTACLETYADSLLVAIVLPRLDYQIYAETANMDFNKFLSQLGGQLGVLMGINLVSFIELVFLVFGLFAVCCRKY